MTSTRPGSRLGGRYRLTERLAFGGMGEVWKGVDEVLGRAVAIKILRPELAGDNNFQRRFREEARTAGALSHPGIAAVYDYGESPLVPPAGDGEPAPPVPEDEISYLVMELVPGEALSAVLSREGALSTDRTLDLVAQTARALHAAHLRGVVHRDVKPANLMVTPERRVKVTDFGIARPQDHEPLTATGQVMGTAHYLAPELARGQAATPLSDVYALGVVAYECLAGRRPFEGDNQVAVATAHLSEPPPPLPETLSPEVRRIVEAAMEKAAERRFQGADAFAAALESARYRLLAGQPPAAELALGEPLPSPPVNARGSTGSAGWGNSTHPGRSWFANGSAHSDPPPPAATARPTVPQGPGQSTPVTARLPLRGGRRHRDARQTPSQGVPGRGWLSRLPRRFSVPLLALIALLVVLVAATVIHAWAGSGDKHSPSGPPTPSPTNHPTPSVSTSPRTSVTTSTSSFRSTVSHPVFTHRPTATRTPTATTTTSPTGTPTSSSPTSSPTSTTTSTSTTSPSTTATH